jgi:SAM-dependent methyltransferase
MSDLPDYALVNRESWTKANAEYTDPTAREHWARERITWGVWSTPEDEIRVLPDVDGKDVIELGCGTAYFGAWLKKRGARRVVGVDVTPAQLETARRMDAEFRLGLELIEANAEDVPLPDEQFDLALSEFGASLWCDPRKWIPEAARLLRIGGDLVFMRDTPLNFLCSAGSGPVDHLVRPQRDFMRMDWPAEGDDSAAVEFHTSHGELLRILRGAGFEVLDLIERGAPPDAVDHRYYTSSAEWSKNWPSEEIWRARKRLSESPDGNE